LARNIPAANCGHNKVAAKLRTHFDHVINSGTVAAASSIKAMLVRLLNWETGICRRLAKYGTRRYLDK
jgi:hypothetical protein